MRPGAPGDRQHRDIFLELGVIPRVFGSRMGQRQFPAPKRQITPQSNGQSRGRPSTVPHWLLAGSGLSLTATLLAATPALVAMAAGDAAPLESPVLKPSAPESLPEPAPARPPIQPPIRATEASPPPRRTEVATPAPAPHQFDQSLDELVRQRVITPAERQRVFTGTTLSPKDSLEHQRACRHGALSEQECGSGVVVRWSGRRTDQPSTPQTLLEGSSTETAAALPGVLGAPLTTPLTVPVSALLAGPGGSFSLSSVFARTPRPAPIGGNGNRRLIFPLIGSAITSSEFGYRLHPVLGSWLMHAGKDLAAPEGTPVVAALNGRVLSSGLAGGYGLAIELEHDGPRRRTLYGHLSELYVKPGDSVRQGEVIGRVGSTGLSTGPHLHFELRLPADGGWVAVDPGDLDPGSTAIGSDSIAMLMGQLLQRLERPQPVDQAKAPSSSQPRTETPVLPKQR